MRTKLAIRIDGSNLDHHLWNNHGTWWIHYTVLVDGAWQRRVRRSLATRSVVEARELRDRTFAELRANRDVVDPPFSADKPARSSLTGTGSERRIAS
ncbi:MAG: hypothetical protein ACJAQ3_001473 [Planctomycetota bacterium]|jgi:hypothetical protein